MPLLATDLVPSCTGRRTDLNRKSDATFSGGFGCKSRRQGCNGRRGTESGRHAMVCDRLEITNDDLYTEPGRIFPGILDRTVNGIYLANDRLDVDKEVQNRRRKVSFCGAPGAFTEIAALEACPGCDLVSSKSWGAAVAALITGDTERAVVPVENFYTKRIRILYDVILKYDLHIVDEVFINVCHMLLGLPETKRDDIRRIVSHPQALVQCERYVREHFPSARIMELPDTAEAALQLAIYRPPHTAVIASRRCADLYHLNVIDENLQDLKSNPTRFVVLSQEAVVPEDIDPNNCKTSILFALPEDEEPGALLRALDYFTKEDINLVWLDSRELSPSEAQGNEWKYLFYANFEGSVVEPRVERALAGLRKQARFFRVMGSHRMQARFLEDFP